MGVLLGSATIAAIPAIRQSRRRVVPELVHRPWTTAIHVRRETGSTASEIHQTADRYATQFAMFRRLFPPQSARRVPVQWRHRVACRQRSGSLIGKLRLRRTVRRWSVSIQGAMALNGGLPLLCAKVVRRSSDVAIRY